MPPRRMIGIRFSSLFLKASRTGRHRQPTGNANIIVTRKIRKIDPAPPESRPKSTLKRSPAASRELNHRPMRPDALMKRRSPDIGILAPKALTANLMIADHRLAGTRVRGFYRNHPANLSCEMGFEPPISRWEEESGSSQATRARPRQPRARSCMVGLSLCSLSPCSFPFPSLLNQSTSPSPRSSSSPPSPSPPGTSSGVGSARSLTKFSSQRKTPTSIFSP